jgi:hypothetical protein
MTDTRSRASSEVKTTEFTSLIGSNEKMTKAAHWTQEGDPGDEQS